MLSNPLPPKGERGMLTVGPSQQCTPFALHSCPIKTPALKIRSESQVAARPVPQGRQAAGTHSKKFVPRMPFGPSLTRIFGTLNLSRGVVCQKSEPYIISCQLCRSWRGFLPLIQIRIERSHLLVVPPSQPLWPPAALLPHQNMAAQSSLS